MSPYSVLFLFSSEFDYSYIHENPTFNELQKRTPCHISTYININELSDFLTKNISDPFNRFIVLIEPPCPLATFSETLDSNTISFLNSPTLPLKYYARVNNQHHLLTIEPSDTALTSLCKQLFTYIETFTPHALYPLSCELGRILIQHDYTLATAESCTGGLIAKTITDVPGASAYFLGGACTYSAAAKINILEVPESTIRNEGIVSHATARAMAVGAQKCFHTNVALSTTGVAGPGPDNDGNPEGLVDIGIAIEDQCYTYQLLTSEECAFTDRDYIRHRCVAFALQKSLEILAN